MKKPLLLILLLTIGVGTVEAQRSKRAASKDVRAVVIDNALGVVRSAPGYFSETVRRVRCGRELKVLGSRTADGALFLKVAVSVRTSGWIQREAVIVRSDKNDETRLLNLALTLRGFDQIHAARIFLNEFPSSPNRPRMLLLFGDLAEESAARLSAQAGKKLNSASVTALGGPVHGYLLNYAGLDRYRKIGITFFVNPAARKLHYSGTAWREILSKFGSAPEATAARERLAKLELDIGG